MARLSSVTKTVLLLGLISSLVLCPMPRADSRMEQDKSMREMFQGFEDIAAIATCVGMSKYVDPKSLQAELERVARAQQMDQSKAEKVTFSVNISTTSL